MHHRQPRAFAMLLAAAAFPICATATTINGGLHFSGDVTISTNTTTGEGFLTWDDVASQTYTFTIDSGTGDLSGLSGGGSEADINSSIAPINTPIDIPDFLTFVNDSGLSFTLTYVYGGVDGTAGCSDNPSNFTPGDTCSPAGTPYNLQDLVNSLGQDTSSASFVVEGFLVDGGTDTPANITFSSADTGKSYEQILLDQSNGTADVITYGAQLNTGAVPEPGTSLMVGAGFVLLGCLLRHRNRRAR